MLIVPSIRQTETSLPNHSKWAQYVSDDEDTQEEEVCSENATYTIDRREFKKCSRQAKQRFYHALCFYFLIYQ